MLCLVKSLKDGSIFPSCSAAVKEGMDVSAESPEIFELRKTALELVLEEHQGDCEAPCRRACPANMDIPLMLDALSRRDMHSAAKIVFEEIPIPSTLGRICPAPCEKHCRRKRLDSPLPICQIKRSVGDYFIHDADRLPLSFQRRSDLKIAVIGSGPCGIGAAWLFSRRGVQSTIFEKADIFGVSLRRALNAKGFSESFIGSEIANLAKFGISLKSSFDVEVQENLSEIMQAFDAIILCTGMAPRLSLPDLALAQHGIPKTDDHFRTSVGRLYSALRAGGPFKMAVKAMAQGAEIADFVLSDLCYSKEMRPQFDSRMSDLDEAEFAEFAKRSPVKAALAGSSPASDLDDIEAVAQESLRCFQCSCAKKDKCGLRDLASGHSVSQTRKRRKKRGPYSAEIANVEGGVLVFEPGKCVKCGVCARLSRKNGEKVGFSFSGRGVSSRIVVPLGYAFETAISAKHRDYASACPTGALSVRELEHKQ